MSRHSLPAGQTGGLIVREITGILNWTLSSEGFTNFQVIDDVFKSRKTVMSA